MLMSSPSQDDTSIKYINGSQKDVYSTYPALYSLRVEHERRSGNSSMKLSHEW
jgi:hypothetical protein